MSPQTSGLRARTADKKSHNLEELAARAKVIRRHIIRMISEAGSGHPGGSLSMVELLVALFFHTFRHRPEEPDWPDRDRFLLSKGHGCPALYSVLAEAGYLPVEELMNLRKLGSPLQGHPDRRLLPLLEASTGSLGQGLSIAVGLALGARLDKRSCRTYVIIGDGESEEGQVWEAVMFAAHQKVDNLTAIVDCNGIQLDGFTKDILDMEPIVPKWESFGWHVQEIDGHDFGQIFEAFKKAASTRGRPSVILARTVKGKGVSFMENNPAFHGKAPTQEETEKALQELS